MHHFHRYLGSHLVAKQHRRNIGNQHAEGSASDHSQKVVVVGGEGDGGNLGLIAHLGQEEGEQRGAKHPVAATDFGILVVNLVRDHDPDRHGEEGDAQYPA